jgi:RNA polymerase sigma-70 factor, ECF subfamily
MYAGSLSFHCRRALVRCPLWRGIGGGKTCNHFSVALTPASLSSDRRRAYDQRVLPTSEAETPIEELVSRLPAALRTRMVDAAADLARLVASWTAEAHRRWPGVRVDPAVFTEHLARHLGESCEDAAELRARLAAAHGADLYLACACSLGDPRAHAALEAEFLPEVARVLRTIRSAGLSDDEVRQLVRIRLLMATPERAVPRIADFAGRGELRKWLRIAATRIVLADFDSRAATHRKELGTSAVAEKLLALPGEQDLERSRMRAEIAPHFKEGFQLALASLTVRERNLLRLKFLHGLTGDQIAGVYGVNRVSAARWFARARDRVLRRTRMHIAQALRLPASELDSLTQMLMSEIDVSLGRILSSTPEAE